jgi:membrane-associated phospholipid phosphatase
VYLGVHWTTDVTAGWLLGVALATACVTVARVLDAHGTPAPPEPLEDDPVPAVDDGSASGPRSASR